MNQIERIQQTSPLLLFAKNFLQHPRMLGSMIPSSRFLIQRILDRVDWAHARVIVEYGPGVGNVSRHVLRRMRPDARLVLIEMNEDFVSLLRAELRDARVTIVHGSAAEVGRILRQVGLDGADYVISGIPYSTIPGEMRQRILHESWNALRQGGGMIVYQFTRKVVPLLREFFPEMEEEFEALNLPPARVWFCKRSETPSREASSYRVHR